MTCLTNIKMGRLLLILFFFFIGVAHARLTPTDVSEIANHIVNDLNSILEINSRDVWSPNEDVFGVDVQVSKTSTSTTTTWGFEPVLWWR